MEVKQSKKVKAEPTPEETLELVQQKYKSILINIEKAKAEAIAKKEAKKEAIAKAKAEAIAKKEAREIAKAEIIVKREAKKEAKALKQAEAIIKKEALAKSKAQAKAKVKKRARIVLLEKAKYNADEKAKVMGRNDSITIQYHISPKAVEVLKKYFKIHKDIDLDRFVRVKDLYDINIYKLTKLADFNANTIVNFVKFLERNKIPTTHEIDSNGRLRVKPILNNIDYTTLVDTKANVRNEDSTFKTIQEKLGFTTNKDVENPNGRVNHNFRKMTRKTYNTIK